MTLFPEACGQFLAWVDGHPLLRAVRATLAEQVAAYRPHFEVALDTGQPRPRARSPIEASTLRDENAISLAVLEVAADAPLPDPSGYGEDAAPLMNLAVLRVGEYEDGSLAASVDRIRDTAVESVYEFFDEALDSRNTVLALLGKYKHRCEWYRRHRLRKLVDDDPERRHGEDAFVFDLYEYLHDHGVDFRIESKTASGEPDLVLEQGSGQRVVVDGKLIRQGQGGTKSKSTLVKGFRQVLDYCRDKQEPVGYLAVFVLDDLRFEFESAETDDAFPCLRLDGTTVYYVFVDLADHPKTASARPKPQVVRVALADVVNATAEDIAEDVEA
ncbi:MAG: hypothetical protein EP329_25920 [Deltaproteobacteria bacterium]|nr:MAG: hypothetical protein EP329_25920 [Deltaproteobacteria bacterium]